MFSRLSKREKAKLTRLIVIALVVLVSFIVTKFEEKAESSKILHDGKDQNSIYHSVHFIDAMQGDCTLIETSGGKFALIDASTRDATDKIISYLQNEGVEELEYVIFTHPHEDHIGGGDDVINTFKVNTVYMNDRTENTTAYENLLESIKNSKKQYGTKVVKAKKGDTFSLDGIEFTILSDGKDYDDANNSSICLMVEYGKTGILFTGDAEKKVEKELLASDFSLEAEIYKCAHHGSSTSNSEKFLGEIDPEICIISCGKDNDYGHPHDEVLEYLYENDIDFYTTHIDGDIVIDFDMENIFLPSGVYNAE